MRSEPRHVYRNRPDDHRQPGELTFCEHCNGFYGVSHSDHGHVRRDDCACRSCREASGALRQGDFGYLLEA